MGQSTILEEQFDEFDSSTGEIKRFSTHKRIMQPKPGVTDQFIKVSRYLNTIFAFNNIPLNLVPISLLIAQEMEFKTNMIYLLKDRKEEFAAMLGVSLDRINKLLAECQRFGIIRNKSRGRYEVNSFLFSTGDMVETRKLQARFDFESEAFLATGEQKNLITGTTVRKAVANKKDKGQLPGQISLEDFGI